MTPTHCRTPQFTSEAEAKAKEKSRNKPGSRVTIVLHTKVSRSLRSSWTNFHNPSNLWIFETKHPHYDVSRHRSATARRGDKIT